MKARYAVLVAIAIAAAVTVTVTSIGAAAPEASKQRVSITAKGAWNPSSFGKFVLTPLRAGALEPDAGTGTATWTWRAVARAGGRGGVSTGGNTPEGQTGDVVIREQMEGVEAGNGYHAAIGTWKVVRGTGQYAQVTGGGVSGNVVVERTRSWYDGREGFLTVP